jgi:hypothetical protein
VREPKTPRPKKLPFWDTVGRAYALPLNYADTLGRVMWLWLGVMTPVLLIMSWLLAPTLADFMAKIGTPASKPPLATADVVVLEANRASARGRLYRRCLAPICSD